MSINQKHFGLSDSLVNAVNEALHPNQKKLDVAEPKGKLDAADFKKLRGEGAKPDFLDLDKDGNKKEPMKKASKEIKEDDAHFEKQSKKMQDAINLHLRKGKSYADAAKAAKVHVKEIANDPDTERKFKNRMTGVKNLLKRTQKEEALDEKAVSQAQQKAAGAALTTQRGEYAGGKKGGAVNRMALMKASELRKIAATKRTGLPMRKEEIEMTEAETQVAKIIAARKEALKTHLQNKIAKKQMSTMQAKANQRLKNINASNDNCSCGNTNESKMKCEVHGGKDKDAKMGREKIEVNPPLREAENLPKKVVTKGHEIAKSLIKNKASVREPYAVGMAQAKKSAGIR